MGYKIINTELKDLDSACQLFDAAIIYQKQKGFPQYISNDREAVAESIKNKLHFKLLIDDEMACVFSIAYSDKIIWREKDMGNALYLHRVITNQKHKGKKLFGHILEWAARLAKKNKLKYIRLDTWDNNSGLVNYHKRFGFKIIEHYKTPDSNKISINCRGNKAC